jgi:prolyl oligopeptidase
MFRQLFSTTLPIGRKSGGTSPILIRIDTKSGHGASSTTKALEQTADVYSFIMFNLGVVPKY